MSAGQSANGLRYESDDGLKRSEPPKLSVVTTVYRSGSTVTEFVRRAIAAAEPHVSSIEIIIVDDGSPDDSGDIVRELAREDDRITLFTLSRNFGHHKAMFAGLEVARGDLIFLIDSDLEERPENFSNMLELMNNSRSDVVYGVQNSRKGNRLEKFSGWLFYKIFNSVSEVELPRNVTTMRLMTRRYLDSFLRFRDRNPVFVPLSALVGYPQAKYEFKKENTSKTTYSLARRFSLLLLAVTSFTARPLVLMFWASLFFSALGLIFGSFVVIRALFADVMDGWTSLMATIVFFFSLNAFFTGIIGMYIKVIMDELRERPRTVIQEVFNKNL